MQSRLRIFYVTTYKLRNRKMQNETDVGTTAAVLSSGCESSSLQTLTGMCANTIKVQQHVVFMQKNCKYIVTTRKFD